MGIIVKKKYHNDQQANIVDQLNIANKRIEELTQLANKQKQTISYLHKQNKEQNERWEIAVKRIEEVVFKNSELVQLVEEKQQIINCLQKQIKEQDNRLEEQDKLIAKTKGQITHLERRLSKNSQNSDKPPSSDVFRKPKSLRPKGGKKGAPVGHKSHNLMLSKTPEGL